MNGTGPLILAGIFVALVGIVLLVISIKGIRKASREKGAQRTGLSEGCFIAMLIVGLLVFLAGAVFGGCAILLSGANFH